MHALIMFNNSFRAIIFFVRPHLSSAHTLGFPEGANCQAETNSVCQALPMRKCLESGCALSLHSVAVSVSNTTFMG